ncbi:spore coat protein [Ornithinibacillus sp. 4-3]|uniref:Spore coat protein n=1 Tax=Ornithinibacillus sp. 4-3 TaxID=3231488 RepID=A0AB39HTK0_9BACI
MRNFRRGRCHCPQPTKQMVHPTKENVVHCCSEETVKHIHPSNTTYVNHHLVKNVHEYPHSTTMANTFNSVDIYGGSYQVPSPNNSVAGAMSPPPGSVGGAMSPYPGSVAGATSPMHHCCPPNNQVGGAQSGRPPKWC